MKTAQACTTCDEPLSVLSSGAFYCWSCDGHMSGYDSRGRVNPHYACNRKGSPTVRCHCYKPTPGTVVPD